MVVLSNSGKFNPLEITAASIQYRNSGLGYAIFVSISLVVLIIIQIFEFEATESVSRSFAPLISPSLLGLIIPASFKIILGNGKPSIFNVRLRAVLPQPPIISSKAISLLLFVSSSLSYGKSTVVNSGSEPISSILILTNANALQERNCYLL
jgi:hypothetical protein